MDKDLFKIYSKKVAKEVQEKMAQFEIKSVDPVNGTFKVVASDETMDRHGEVILASGRQLENYMKNPIILFGHDYWTLESVIGKATRVYVENNQLIVEGVFASAEANPNAQMVRHLYDEGILKTVSVGLRVLGRNQEDPDIIEKAELLELSFVPVPANPNALDAKEFETYLAKGLIIKAEDVPEKTETEQIKEDIKTIKETQVKTLELIQQIADGNAKKLTDKTLEAKQALQDIDKTVGDALRNLKIS